MKVRMTMLSRPYLPGDVSKKTWKRLSRNPTLVSSTKRPGSVYVPIKTIYNEIRNTILTWPKCSDGLYEWQLSVIISALDSYCVNLFSFQALLFTSLRIHRRQIVIVLNLKLLTPTICKISFVS